MKIKNLNIITGGNDGNEIVSERNLGIKFKNEGIINERVDLYREFLINVSNYVNGTYLGTEYIRTSDDIIGHFNWCFNKTSEEFNKFIPNIDFSKNNKLRKTLYLYFLTNVYEYELWLPELDTCFHFFNHVMDFRNEKTYSELDIMIDLYKDFDVSFK